MTPIRRQYLDVKRRFPHAIVFFRLGDFYETFDDDARLCARELDLVLTSRPLGKSLRVPMAGIPHHAVNGYLARLIARGHRVAVCDQVGDTGVKGLVERAVTRVITPGTVLTDDLLRGPAANYLAAVVPDEDGRHHGLAYVDVSTGEFVTACLDAETLAAELARLAPAETLLPDGAGRDLLVRAVTACDPRVADAEWAERRLCEHFGVASLAAFGCAGLPVAVRAAAVVVQYLADTQPAIRGHITALRTADHAAVMALDAHTRRNLELFEPAQTADPGTARDATLFAAVDRTRTPMGQRLLRARLGQPLRDPAAIDARLDAVARFVDAGVERSLAREHLGRIPDLERLLGRVVAGFATPRDLLGLRRGLEAAEALGTALGDAAPLPPLPDVSEPAAVIACAIDDAAPVALDQGGVIRPGFDGVLDGLRSVSRDARQVMAALERSEREATGIRSLKVGYNRVFGYYLEVSHAHAALVPERYQRRQTLAGAERFVTPELKEEEARVLGAEERIAMLEAELFRRVCASVAAHAATIRDLAAAVAAIDVAAGLAEVAAERAYVRPIVDDGDAIDIRDGRHPVVEQVLPPGSFVSNDTALSEAEQILVLTGPNMAGKSTYLRQVALIVLLAQAGCFVPARAARIGVADRIFTRIGAQDDLAGGNSTFMVEMIETAHILHHATPRSLVILDEVGRGTSTYDGLSIARAVVEYLHNRRQSAARTLFATHYHELTALAGALSRVRNANVAVAEQDGAVVFLRRIVPGGADRSYGIHVAHLAGLPRAVTSRAAELLEALEQGSAARAQGPAPVAPGRRRRDPPSLQLPLFGGTDPLREELAALDVDALTPLDALTRLYDLRERARHG